MAIITDPKIIVDRSIAGLNPTDDSNDPLPAFAGVPRNTAELDKLATDAAEVTGRLDSWLGEIEKQLDLAERAAEQVAESAYPTRVGEASGKDEAAKREIAARHYAAKHKEIVTAAGAKDAPRAEMQRALETAAANAAKMMSLFPSPASMLRVYGLQNAETTARYASLLANAPLAHYETVRNYAAATGDRALAAAVLGAVERISNTERRPFNAEAFAAEIFSKEHEAMKAKVADLRLTAQRAADRWREAETGRTNPVNKIARGLARRAAGVKQ